MGRSAQSYCLLSHISVALRNGFALTACGKVLLAPKTMSVKKQEKGVRDTLTVFDLAVTQGLPRLKSFVIIVLEATMPSRSDDSLAQAFGYQTAQQTGRQRNA